MHAPVTPKILRGVRPDQFERGKFFPQHGYLRAPQQTGEDRESLNLEKPDGGTVGDQASPFASGRPNMTFKFWTACPAAPFSRLSRAATTRARLPFEPVI